MHVKFYDSFIKKKKETNEWQVYISNTKPRLNTINKQKNILKENSRRSFQRILWMSSRSIFKREANFKEDDAISTLNGKPVKLVDHFTYLSSNISSAESDVCI